MLRPSAKTAADTTWFGGTHWDAADGRWEANAGASRTNRWTFDSGVDGNLEGWTSVDLTAIPPPTLPPDNPDNADFRWVDRARYDLYGTLGTELFPTVTPPDTGGIWVGKFEEEAGALCYAGGQGYGNRWKVEARKAFTYGGSGGVSLTFRYFQNSEKTYDFTYLYLEFNGVREASPRVEISVANLGRPTSKLTKVLPISAASIPSGTTEIATVFRFTSDYEWSDEDGSFTTDYGPFCCYNFAYQDLGTPANNDEDTFELGPEGWTFSQGEGVGAFTSVRSLAELPPEDSECPCAGRVLQGNVLVQYDTSGGQAGPHPDGQDELSLSPYIDLEEAGLSSLPARLVVADAYVDLPLSQAVYYKVWLYAYPVTCPATGLPVERWIAPDPFITYNMAPECLDDLATDFSQVAGDLEYCRVGLEVLSVCSTSTECVGTGGGNTTPWWDNIALAVTGTPGAPPIGSAGIDMFFQDIWSADGSLSPSSTCVLDNSGDANFGTGLSDADLGDTICVAAGGDDIEVDLWFQYRKGPGTRTANAFFSRYPSEDTWYSARCDTARSGNPSVVEQPGLWCSEYHEESPYFAGENAEANEILPDYVFTPGSHIEYYWSVHKLATPSVESYWPDVPSGEQPLSVDLLPMMHATSYDTTWPCNLYINAESRQPLTADSPYHEIEAALGSFLPQRYCPRLPGFPESKSAPASTLDDRPLFDRFDDVLVGSNMDASFGRQDIGENGMGRVQALGYSAIFAVYGAAATYTISEDDASLLHFWLTTSVNGANEYPQLLYLSGDAVAADMSSALKPTATSLLNNDLGALFRCDPYRAAGCPTGSVADTSFCVQLSPAEGADEGFNFTGAPYMAYGNGCPAIRPFSVLEPNPAVSSARPNLDYVDQNGTKGTTHDASVTNVRAGYAAGNYWTLIDGVGLSRFRHASGSDSDCSNDSLAIADRVRDVIFWSNLLVGVDPGEDVPGVPRSPALEVAPNPFNPLVKLNYTVGVPGRVTLRIFDVRGALVTTLVDQPRTPGRYQAVWTGVDANGRKVASGVFWAKYAIGGKEIEKQLVLLK